MKKILLCLAMGSFGLVSRAQVIASENFDAYFPGELNSDMTGQTAANGIFTIATNGTAPTTANNAGADNFEIIENDGAHFNVLQVVGTNGNKGGRVFWFESFTDGWETRDSGKEIVEVEFELFTGPGGGTSLNTIDMRINGDAGGTIVLSGFSFDTKTLVLRGIAYYNAPAPGTLASYYFYLGGGQNNVVLPANTWVRLGASFNKTTGQVYWRGKNGATQLFAGQVLGAGTGMDPVQTNFMSLSGTTTTPPATNTDASVVMFDNFMIRAAASDSLLDVVQIAHNDTFAVYPNPARDMVHIASGSGKIKSVSLVDINGRTVRDASFGNVAAAQVDISDLASGVYIVNIESAEGSTTRKIVKQ